MKDECTRLHEHQLVSLSMCMAGIRGLAKPAETAPLIHPDQQAPGLASSSKTIAQPPQIDQRLGSSPSQTLNSRHLQNEAQIQVSGAQESLPEPNTPGLRVVQEVTGIVQQAEEILPTQVQVAVTIKDESQEKGPSRSGSQPPKEEGKASQKVNFGSATPLRFDKAWG